MISRQTAVSFAIVMALLRISSQAAAQKLAAQKPADQPETVLVTLRPKAGAEAALEKVLARHWSAASALNLVRETPHLTLRATEGSNRTYFVEIFTWRDASIPDAPPPAIQAIWAEMNQLVEARDGNPGLAFREVSVVAQEKPKR